MTTQRAIRGVLGNFLGTYTSRYSDFDGYWLFGFLVDSLSDQEIDLLATACDGRKSPICFAIESAAAKFEDQMRKAGLERSQVREASLSIRRLSEPLMGAVNGRPSAGYNLSFKATAMMESGRRYESERIVFVAPHNPKFELRSTRVA